MGRPKFSFPIPGRKSRTKTDRDNISTVSSHSTTSLPQYSRHKDFSASKAERLLGTASPNPSASRDQSLHPPDSGYMTITVSEASFGSDGTDKASMAAREDGSLRSTRGPRVVHQASSNILGNTYHDDDQPGSYASSMSGLRAKNSSSTLRSYYDPDSSPLYISQQTSASAVRDMALRKGYPQIALNHRQSHVLDSSSRNTAEDRQRDRRKSKPALLDLSKLFPKPRANGTEQALLSPNKMVNSPTAMSTTSNHFPRPMTREPTPQQGGARLIKTEKRHQPPTSQRSTPPVRSHQRDMYDNAKVNVRRPPGGIHHWFDGLGEESDDAEHEEEHIHIIAPTPVSPHMPRHLPVERGSLARYIQDSAQANQHTMYTQHGAPISRKEQHLHANLYDAHRLSSPSQTSLVSSRTKTSTFSRSNLQDSSVLSLSSSEDEAEEDAEYESAIPPKFVVRDSLGTMDEQGEIIIGRAQAYEVRPRFPGRQNSVGKMSMLSTSTNAATIEVMYTPEPYSPFQYPGRPFGSRRSSHVRQPSVIPEYEDERPKTYEDIQPKTQEDGRSKAYQDIRPKTSAHPPRSPTSVLSGRTSTSEPRPRPESHKLMAVTAEEEALLEMMRRKRAAMAKRSFSDGHRNSLTVEDKRQNTPPENNAYRTSGFLAADTPASSPSQVTSATNTRKPNDNTPPLLLQLPRGRPIKSSHAITVETSMRRDSSSCAPDSEHRVSLSPRSSLAHQLSPAPAFSPIEMFPFPFATPTQASIASTTTTDHLSPLPSPVTPKLRNGEADLRVKVASSEPSYNSDSSEDIPVLAASIINPLIGHNKHGSSHDNITSTTQRQRRRTSSSGAEPPLSPTTAAMLNSFPHVLKTPTFETPESRPVSEISSRAPSVVEPPLSMKNARRLSKSTSTGNLGGSRSSNGSIQSAQGISPATGYFDRVSRSRVNSIRRESVATSCASSRNSVSEDVLAAWNSLGGSRF
jgi:hypothetical protein